MVAVGKGKARGGILGTINFHAAASRSQEVNAVLTKYFREGVKSLHTRAKILFLTHNQFSQQQQHVIRRGDRSKLVQRLVQAPEVNLWAAMANNTKPGAYRMPNNTESRNTQCPMPGS